MSLMAYTGVSIVDYLKSIGVNSSMSNRKKIAAKAGIKGYKGTAAQNTKLLADMRSGAISSNGTPKKATTTTTTKKATTTNKASTPALTPQQAQAVAVLNNPNQSLESIISEITKATGTTKDTYVKPDLLDTIDPSMLDVDAMSSLLGMDLTYDRDAIEDILQGAVTAEYDLRGAEQDVAERKYSQHMATAQNTALDTLRQQQGQAIAQGASKGMSAANELSAVLGISQQAAEEATQLAQDRQLMAKEQGAARAQATSSALTQANEAYMNFGALSRQHYNDQIQQLAAELAYNQGINTDYAGYQANKYSADQSLLAAIQQSGSNVYGGNQSSLASIQQAIEQAEAQRYAADQQLEAQRITSQSNIEAARLAANAAAAQTAAYRNAGAVGGKAPTPAPKKVADPGLPEVKPKVNTTASEEARKGAAALKARLETAEREAAKRSATKAKTILDTIPFVPSPSIGLGSWFR